MIFISHSHADKAFVETIAHHLAETFGRDRVFYDSWSITPGDSIIGRMNDALEACTYFFFIVSGHSKASYAVGLEWQSALMRAGKAGVTFVPIRAANCSMPAVLASHRYIDLYEQGIEVAVPMMREAAAPIEANTAPLPILRQP